MIEYVGIIICTILYINGCSKDSDSSAQPAESATQSGLLSADFEYTVSEDNPLSVFFLDTSSGNIISRKWNFGDSNTSIEQNPIHIYYSVGTYIVSLTITDKTGHKFVASTEIDIKQ